MQFRKERNFLKSLCKGHIQDLVSDVGWNNLQCAMVTKRYLEFKSVPRICMDIGISESTYQVNFIEILRKFKSYLIRHSDTEIAKLYADFKA